MILLETSREYLFFSILSYYNFPDYSEGKYIKDLIEDIDYLSLSSSSSILKNDLIGKGERFFDKEVNEWKIYSIDDRTGNKKSKSGFFAVVFQKKDKYIISYRGSQTYPFEEAYKDFIEADLIIGLGKKPLQFWEGLEVYENLIKDGIPHEKISITGHSLGGGIAQFVAIMVYKKYKFCPWVCTWNSVGIRRDGIVGVEDFIEYQKLLLPCELNEKEKNIFDEFKDDYIEFIMKELKKQKIIKDNKTVLFDGDFKLNFELTQEFFQELIKQTNLEKILKKIPIARRRQLLIKERIIEKLFLREDLSEKIKDAKLFIDTINENKVFEGRVINFCHSKDFVSCLFPHIGTTYQVDLNFLKKDVSKLGRFFRNLKLFNKSFQEFHFEDVFIPLIDKNGVFSQKLSEEYMASVIRKIIYFEKSFTNDFLAEYFSLRRCPYNNVEKFQLNLQRGIIKCQENILYKDKVLESVRNMPETEILRLWTKVLRKLPSPYSPKDIYDLIVFRKIYI